jgi:hypothetical protein
MDEITKDIQGNIPWWMLFVDDMVLIDESRIGVDQKLILWRQTLELKVLDLVGLKTNIWGVSSAGNTQMMELLVWMDK